MAGEELTYLPAGQLPDGSSWTEVSWSAMGTWMGLSPAWSLGGQNCSWTSMWTEMGGPTSRVSTGGSLGGQGCSQPEAGSKARTTRALLSMMAAKLLQEAKVSWRLSSLPQC